MIYKSRHAPTSGCPAPGVARRAWRRGFTLVEVIAAAAVMAFSLGGAVMGIQIGINNLDAARTSTAVAQALQAEAERVRMLNWAALTALPAEARVDLTSMMPSDAIATGRVVVTRSISDVSGFANMKEIRLSAAWKSLNGKPRERVFRMRYAKGGLHDYYYSASGS